MPTEQKIATVADLKEKLGRMQFAVFAHYRGMSVADMTNLRAKLRATGAELLVAKNTLIRLAARETGHDAIESLLEGPTIVAFAYEDAAKTAKVITDFVRIQGQQPKFVVRGALLGRTAIPADGLDQVVRLPSREQALAMVLGGVVAPVTGVVGVLNAVVSNIAYVVQARIDQLQPPEQPAA